MNQKAGPRKQIIKIGSQMSQIVELSSTDIIITVINMFRNIYDKTEFHQRKESIKKSNGNSNTKYVSKKGTVNNLRV